MIIRKLHEKPEFCNQIHKWLLSEWGSRPLLKLINEIQNDSAIICEIPSVYVGYEGNQPYGTISLIYDDMDEYSKLNPWLGYLYVDVAHRKKGYGALLFDWAMLEASRMGHQKLYLFTSEITCLALSRGWKKIGQMHFEKNIVTIMEINLHGK